MNFPESVNLYKMTKKILKTLEPILVSERDKIGRSPLIKHRDRLNKIGHLTNDCLNLKRTLASISTDSTFTDDIERHPLTIRIAYTTLASIGELKKYHFSKPADAVALRCLKTYKLLLKLELQECGIGLN